MEAPDGPTGPRSDDKSIYLPGGSDERRSYGRPHGHRSGLLLSRRLQRRRPIGDQVDDAIELVRLREGERRLAVAVLDARVCARTQQRGHDDVAVRIGGIVQRRAAILREWRQQAGATSVRTHVLRVCVHSMCERALRAPR